MRSISGLDLFGIKLVTIKIDDLEEIIITTMSPEEASIASTTADLSKSI